MLIGPLMTVIALGGDLACQLVTTTDPSLEDRWRYEQADHFQVRQTDSVFRGQRVTICPFFTGYGTEADGKAALTYSIRITRPDGKVYHESEGHVGWDRAADPDDVRLAIDLVGLSFDPPDELGTYTIRVHVTDGVTGSTVDESTQVTLLKYEEGADFADSEALVSWIESYASAPEPERLVPAFRVHCRNAGFQDGAAFQSGDGFFRELLSEHAWLIDELFSGWKKLTNEEKRGALWLLARAPFETAPFVAKLARGDKATWNELSGAADDPLMDALGSRHDVNELYGRYLATGRLAPLERLVRALHADGGVISNGTTRSGDVEIPLTAVVPRVVRKLLEPLLATDPLARDYAQALLQEDDLPEGVAGVLGELL